MLTIIHGGDIIASRRFFLEEKNRQPGAVFLSQAEIDLTGLAQILEGGGLFDESKVLFIEQFLSERKKSAEKEAIIAYIKDQGVKNVIVMWEGKELSPAALTPFKEAKIKSFKLSTSLFVFLEALKPGNGLNCIQLFHKAIEGTDAEMVFFMLVRQIRILLAVSAGSGENISEVTRLAPWQRSRIENQAKFFSASGLRELYRKLFSIETAQKTGTLGVALTAAVDFILLEI